MSRSILSSLGAWILSLATVNDDDDDDLQLDGFRISLVFGWHSLVEGMKRLEGEP